MSADNILEPHEFIGIDFVQRPYAMTKPYMENYAIIIGEPWFEEIYNILSYSSLLKLLNGQLLEGFRNKINETLLGNLKPLVSDQRFNLTENLNAHVSRVAYCRFPFKCLLSHTDDPLLNRIQELYNILIKMFKHALPGNTQHMRNIYSTSGFSGLFNLTKPDCYKYAECYGIESYSPCYPNLVYLNLIKIDEKNTTIMSLPSMRKLKTKRNCKPLVFMCDVTGSCSTTLFSNLFKEAKRGVKYIKKNTMKFEKTNELLTVDKPFSFSSDDGCHNLYIYSDATHKYTLFPNNVHDLAPFFNRYYDFFSEFVSTLFWPLESIKDAEFCPGDNCLIINFFNKMPNTTSQIQDSSMDEQVPYFIAPDKFAFIPPFEKYELAKSWKLSRDLSARNLRIYKVANGSVLTIERAANLDNLSNIRNNSRNSQNSLQTASINLLNLGIILGIIIFAAILTSLQTVKHWYNLA